MSHLAKRPGRLVVAAEHMREIVKEPLRILPAAVQPAALKVWTMHRHLYGMDSPLSLAGAVSVWIEDWGLHPDDAAKLLTRMTHPSKMKTFEKTADLMTAIAFEADQAIADRERAAEAAARDRDARGSRAPLPAGLLDFAKEKVS